MAEVGDRVQAPSKKVGQQPREGVVTGVSGALLRVKWSTGEESTITPSVGSLIVVGKVRRTSAGRGAGAPTKQGPGAKKAVKAPAKRPAQSGRATAKKPSTKKRK
jgi:hypothetical protein